MAKIDVILHETLHHVRGSIFTRNIQPPLPFSVNFHHQTWRRSQPGATREQTRSSAVNKAIGQQDQRQRSTSLQFWEACYPMVPSTLLHMFFGTRNLVFDEPRHTVKKSRAPLRVRRGSAHTKGANFKSQYSRLSPCDSR